MAAPAQSAVVIPFRKVKGNLQAASEERVREAELDRALVQRVQRGDQTAFDALVRKYQFRIGHLVSGYLKDSGDVEDVVQEAFIKAYRAIGGFRGDSAFYTWMYRIAINTAKNHLVAIGRRPPAQDVDIEVAEFAHPGAAMSDIETPEGRYRTNELTAVIERALSELPDDLAQAVKLREIEGMSYEEIAQNMACPIGTVRSRIFRAREALDKAVREIVD